MYRYFGTRINAADVNNLATPLYGHLNAYPAYGLDITNNAALAMTHSDGNMSTALKVTGFDEQEDDKGKLLTIHLNDPVYPVFVDLKYRAFKDVDIGSHILQAHGPTKHSSWKKNSIRGSSSSPTATECATPKPLTLK